MNFLGVFYLFPELLGFSPAVRGCSPINLGVFVWILSIFGDLYEFVGYLSQF